MSGRRSRDKGQRTERAVVHLLQAAGFEAKRSAPLQTYASNDAGDVEAVIGGHKRKIEVKCRADGFREIYRWLEPNDFLILKADRREMLVVMPVSTAMELMNGYGAGSADGTVAGSAPTDAGRGESAGNRETARDDPEPGKGA